MNICQGCRNSQSSINSKLAAKRKAIGKPVLSKSPLSKFSKQRLAVAVHTLLERQKKLEAKVNQLGNEIPTQVVNLEEVVNSDLKMLVDNAAAKNSFQNLFRKEQKKYFRSTSKGFPLVKPPLLRVSISLLQLSLLAFDKS